VPQNFLECDREQVLLVPPDPRDWLPEGHLAWFMLATVEELNLAAFYASYRLDGWGRAAFEPRMMVSLLLYAYARGERSGRHPPLRESITGPPPTSTATGTSSSGFPSRARGTRTPDLLGAIQP
jgi:hypothetical protein